jgi:hypothetical protein
MMKVTFLHLVLFGTSSAFVQQRLAFSLSTKLAATKLEEDMDRAVKCAENYGLCDVDELMELADGMLGLVVVDDWFLSSWTVLASRIMD